MRQIWQKLSSMKWWNVRYSHQGHRRGIPLFGMDIGGTLTKLVYLEPKGDVTYVDNRTIEILKNMVDGLNESAVAGVASRDVHLKMDNVTVGSVTGTLNFIRFPSREMLYFIEQAKKQGMASLIATIGATGGGAYKYEQNFATELNVKCVKFDELDSLLKGMMHVVKNNPKEVYYWHKPSKDDINRNLAGNRRKEPFEFVDPYPFIIVNIGSGVSILAVYGPFHYKRITGTSLGGGTFLGLCCLLADCKTFEEAIELATRGDHTQVDKLVKDIYGGDYDKFGLPGRVVASSFGKMCYVDNRQNVTKHDLARATLVTITTNIGSIAHMCAVNLNISHVVFVGNFLRINPLSQKLLAYAMDYWSESTKKALFLEHEVTMSKAKGSGAVLVGKHYGYFGAVGCMTAFNEFRLR